MFNISEENQKFLIELSQKMNEQDNRATQYPLFEVRQKVKNYCIGGNNSERTEDIDVDDLCPECKKLYNNNKELPDYCDNCYSCCFNTFDWKDEIVDDCGVFFTAEAAQKHIDENHYHYNEPFVFATGSWRNPEMQKVMQIISSLTTEDGKPRDCYK